MLNPQLWLERPGFSKVLKALGPDHIKLVGGAVRDLILGTDVSDFDLATDLKPQQVIQRLEDAGIKAVPTGLAHGTVSAIAGGHQYEITTLRRDVQSFGRHAEVAFTDDWQEDAARRDFTVNALYAHPTTGVITDWFGGLEDLQARHVRFIGQPMERIAEDHLRILRFFRFSARYARELDQESLLACAARANDLMALSRERIRDELLKLLAVKNPLSTIYAMIEHGIFKPVVPEITSVERLQAVIAEEEKAGVCPNALRRLASLLPADPKLVGEIGARLKMSNAERLHLGHLADVAPVPADPRALAYKTSGAATLDRLLLTADPRAEKWKGQLHAYTRPRLVISGKDLIEMGLPPGPAVSKRMAEVENRWIAAGFPAERHKVMAIAREVLGVI